MYLKSSLLALLAANVAQAQQFLVNELSFGHAGRLFPPDSAGSMPNFNLKGSDRPPQVLSNKVILTPISPGNQRGALWSRATLEHTDWVADVDFRANGVERGGGNLNIWLAKNGEADVGSSSIYTVGRFEGLALVIDSHGGAGGILRAYLNDGSTDFKTKSTVDELAFGHCPFSYRNLGRPSQIKIAQNGDGFKVQIDGRLCFETNKVRIPTGYAVGLTAATPDNPDSFEVFKLVIMSEKSKYDQYTKNNDVNYNQAQQPPIDTRDVPSSDGFDSGPADQNADLFLTSQTQFQDLHNRLQSTNHQLSSIYRSVSRQHQFDEQRHNEVVGLLNQLKGDLAKLDQIDALRGLISNLEREIQHIRNDVNRKIQSNENSFKSYLSDHHATLSQTVMDSMPGHGKLIFVIVGTQVILVVGYILYKRRRANSPKKYL